MTPQSLSPDVITPPDTPLNGYQEVLDHLKRNMFLGHIRVGDRLPPERKLAEHLGVARETLRQALRILEGSGSIIIRRGAHGGAFVQSAPVDREATLRFIRENQREILDVIEFRQVVEGAAARLAAERHTADELERLREAQALLLSSESLNDCRDHDTNFHLTLARASRNRELIQAIENARIKMFRVVDVIDYKFIRSSSHGAHERLLNALEARDGDAAEREMRAHLDTTREEFEVLFTR